jgi:hypothetical protein
VTVSGPGSWRSAALVWRCLAAASFLSLWRTGRLRKAVHQAWYHSRHTAYQCLALAKCEDRAAFQKPSQQWNTGTHANVRAYKEHT